MPTDFPVDTDAPTTRDLRGAALKRARTTAGLTALDLAQRVNQRTAGSDLTHHAIYSYERGKVLLSQETGLRIAETLNLHPGELLLGDPDYAPSGTPGTTPGTTPAPGSSAVTGPSGTEAGGSAGESDTAPPPVASELFARRVALSKAARLSLPVGNVLYRLLDRAEIGRADIRGYRDLFLLLIRDLRGVAEGPAGRETQRLGSVEGNDLPLQLYRVAERFHRQAEQTLRDLLGYKDPDDPALYDACQSARDTLGRHLRTLEIALRDNDRGLGGLPDAPTSLLPQVPTYDQSQLTRD
jgi:DNA-binding XRE family transcriptional regulator